MQYHSSRPNPNIVFTILLAIFTALSLNACGDTNNVSGPEPLSPDAQLSTLTVTPGTLQPAFSGDVANYTVNVLTTVTSVTVTATPQDANASMKINGQATTSGQARTIALGGPGSSTPILIVVTAVSGSQNTYIVTVNQAALGGNNNLQSLTVSPGTLTPAFTADQLSYTVNVVSTVTTVTVSATKSDPNATMSGSVTAGPGQATGQATITLHGPGTSTPVSITVTAQNGTSSKTYTIIVNRALPANSNNNLSALIVSAGALSPAFSAGTLNYNVAVPNTTLTTTVTATVADSTATLTINGSSAISGIAAGPIALSVGANQIPIVVTAQDETPKTYTVTVNRAAIVLSENNNLSALGVSAGALVPAFDATTTNYTVTTLIGTDTTVTATVADSTATLTINGLSTISGVESASIPLAQGTNSISIVVTAENGSPKTYTVTITRIL